MLKNTVLNPECYNALPDAVIAIDINLKIMNINSKGIELLKLDKKNILGKKCSSVLRSTLCETSCPFKNGVYSEIRNQKCYIIDTDGYKIPVSISTAPIKNEKNKIVGIIESIRDLRENELHSIEKEGLVTCNYSSVSPCMKKIFDILPTISKSSSTLLILGETGTGKGYLARTIHNLGNRCLEPFTELNCNSIPETLIESELFGYIKGAFTGADNNKKGFIESTGKGTIFLDEIGDLPFSMQTKILRLIQDKAYEPLGSTKTKRCEARIIAATNRNLEQMVEKGLFRKDLYYRLNVINIKMPELNERKEDIITLAELFINKFNKSSEHKISGMSKEVVDIFLNYSWPGNIRELENVIERAFVLSQNSILDKDDLPECLLNFNFRKNSSPESIKENESIFIKSLLEKYGYNYTAVAEKLGIHRTTLYRKLKKINIDDAKTQQ